MTPGSGQDLVGQERSVPSPTLPVPTPARGTSITSLMTGVQRDS